MYKYLFYLMSLRFQFKMYKQEFDMRLILEVEAYPFLYNKQLFEYKITNKKEQAWEDIATVLGKPGMSKTNSRPLHLTTK